MATQFSTKYKSFQVKRFLFDKVLFIRLKRFLLRFPMGRDSSTFWNKGTELLSLSRDKGTTGQAQNLVMGRNGPSHTIKS